jgi:NADH:ubiquinone oxidoreductase subunit E
MIPKHLKASLEQRIADANTNREAAVDVMKELQRHYGWLTDEALVRLGPGWHQARISCAGKPIQP